jgi:hypothetical protein
MMKDMTSMDRIRAIEKPLAHPGQTLNLRTVMMIDIRIIINIH